MLSTYYFQRLFSYVAGVSLSEYIRRRRMSQAAFKLQRTDEKVLDVALKYGYTSPTSFSRAFQSVHGITPAAAKSKGTTLNAYLPIKFSVKVTGGNAMPYRIAETEAIRIAGIRTSHFSIRNRLCIFALHITNRYLPVRKINHVNAPAF
ncbi:helix-turn-helix transcriptional regulator [Acetatifactor aquisgranensis]|uniref:helix-turn-helix transcriptional regulator n=1 Tax=Acetatifactor aquisgranensis TaxID=2941233 RepID=UPI002ED458B0